MGKGRDEKSLFNVYRDSDHKNVMIDNGNGCIVL